MIDVQDDRHPIETLAEEFLGRFRQGENPSITEYTLRYPELADEIREVFPAVTLLEELKGPPPHIPATATSTYIPTKFGDFHIIAEIGRGGMGIVYEAIQISLDRRVALKVLPDQGRLKPEHLERFRREAVAAGRLHHTNIVPVFGVGEFEGRHYYVMQFIPGQGLDHILGWLSVQQRQGSTATPGQLAHTMIHPVSAPEGFAVTPQRSTTAITTLAASPSNNGVGGSLLASSRMVWFPSINDPEYYRQVARIGSEVADALAYAHGQGIFHRDIKPANLLLDDGGQIWVTDFGLAKLSEKEDLTRPGEMAGTLRYSAPERFKGQSDGRSDLFSLALTLYELCTLRPAYDEQDPGRLVVQVMNGKIERPRTHNPAIPRDLETILLRALEVEPTRRYASASAMADDLRRFLDDRPIQARRTSPIEHAWRWCRRNPAVAGLSTALIVAILVGFGFTLVKWREAEFNYTQAQNANDATRRALNRVEAERGRTEEQRKNTEIERKRADEQRDRAKGNLDLALEAFERISKQLLGRATTPLDSGGEEPLSPPVLTPASAAILQSLVQFYERFSNNNSSDDRLQLDVAKPLRLIGIIRLRLGENQEAEKALRQAETILKERGGSPLERAQILNDLGVVLRASNHFREAMADHTAALQMLKTITPSDPSVKLEQARAHNLIGSLQMRMKQARDAERSQRDALAILSDLLKSDAENPHYRHTQARAYHDLSVAVGFRDRQESFAAREKARELLEHLRKDFAAVPDYTAELIEVLLGFQHRSLSAGLAREAEKRVQRAVDLAQDLAKNYPAVPEYQQLLVRARERLGQAQKTTERTEQAVAQAQKASRAVNDFTKRLSKNPFFIMASCEGRLGMAQMMRKRNDLQGAEKLLRNSLDDIEKAVGSNPRNPKWRSLQIRHYENLGETLRSQGKTSEAEKAFQKAKALKEM